MLMVLYVPGLTNVTTCLMLSLESCGVAGCLSLQQALADHNARPPQGWLGAFMAEAQARGRLEQVWAVKPSEVWAVKLSKV